MNSNSRDGGILTGNWANEDSAYADGTAPLAWTGSIKILEEYMENKGRRSVKYGQCWVFSGVVVSGINSNLLAINLISMIRNKCNLLNSQMSHI